MSKGDLKKVSCQKFDEMPEYIETNGATNDMARWSSGGGRDRVIPQAHSLDSYRPGGGLILKDRELWSSVGLGEPDMEGGERLQIQYAFRNVPNFKEINETSSEWGKRAR